MWKRHDARDAALERGFARVWPVGAGRKGAHDDRSPAPAGSGARAGEPDGRVANGTPLSADASRGVEAEARDRVRLREVRTDGETDA